MTPHTAHPAYAPPTAIPTHVDNDAAAVLVDLAADWNEARTTTWRTRRARLGLMLVHLADATRELEELEAS